MDIDRAIKTRKSIRKFFDKKPNWRKVIRAIDLARFAPAAGNQRVLKFIFVRDEGKIEKLADACQQKFVDAPYIVVAVSEDTKLKKSYEERGEKYGRQQAGAAIENFLLGLNKEGLATCWVGHFDDVQVKRVLDIPDDAVVEALFPIGKETKSMSQRIERKKPELENMLYFDKWKNKLMEPETVVSKEGR